MQEDNMTYGDLVARVDFDMTRASPFSYVCNACNRCCRNKAIRVNPYEILRLARRLGLSTTEFLDRNTEAGGTVLRSNESGDCVFLGEHGCTVHPDRPLACRIYPLARWVSADGEESFGHLAPHPQTAGVYGKLGTVQGYLDLQGVQPFFDIGDRYGALYAKMLALLERLDSKELDRRQERRDAVDMLPSGTLASLWLDIDASEEPSAAPDDHGDAVDRHIRAIEDWLRGLEEEHFSDQ
jgi:uncharacterized protein